MLWVVKLTDKLPLIHELSKKSTIYHMPDEEIWMKQHDPTVSSQMNVDCGTCHELPSEAVKSLQTKLKVQSRQTLPVIKKSYYYG